VNLGLGNVEYLCSVLSFFDCNFDVGTVDWWLNHNWWERRKLTVTIHANRDPWGSCCDSRYKSGSRFFNDSWCASTYRG